MVKGRLYAFVGLERIGGIVTLDLSDPRNPEYVDYVNNRAFRDAAGEPVPTCAEFDPPDSDEIDDCVGRTPRPATSAPRASSSCQPTSRRAASRS